MKKILMTVLLVNALVFYHEAGFSKNENERTPFVTIEKAIDTAVSYAKSNGINLQGKYIKRVEYQDNNNGSSCWNIYWVNEYISKGGDVEMKLCADGTVEKNFFK